MASFEYNKTNKYVCIQDQEAKLKVQLQII